MNKIVEDELVDSIIINPSQEKKAFRPVEIQGAEVLLVLTSSLNFFNLSEINYIASGVWERQRIGINGTGFRYPTDELDPGEAALEGVEVYNPLGEIQVNIPAFERLMVRYFRILSREANQLNYSVTQQSWWFEFITIIKKIDERLQL